MLTTQVVLFRLKMVLQADKERMRTLLREAIPMMCKSGLQFESNFEVEALVGITLDQDVFLISIKESFKSDFEEAQVEDSAGAGVDTNSHSMDDGSAGPTSPKTKKRRRRSKDSNAKKSRRDTADTSSDESDNDAASPTSPAQSRVDNQVLALEETSLETADEVIRTIESNNSTNRSVKVKQEKQDDGSDSDDLVVVKEEAGYFGSHNSDATGGSQGGGGSVFPGVGNSLSQASSSSFGLPQFQSPNMNNPQDMHPGPSLDLSASQLLPPQHDPQQVGLLLSIYLFLSTLKSLVAVFFCMVLIVEVDLQYSTNLDGRVM